MSLVVSAYWCGPATDETEEFTDWEDGHHMAGVERARQELWGSGSVRRRGATFLPRAPPILICGLHPRSWIDSWPRCGDCSRTWTSCGPNWDAGRMHTAPLPQQLPSCRRVCTGTKRRCEHHLNRSRTGLAIGKSRPDCFASAGNGETPRPSYTTTRQESLHAKAPQELYARREGRHPPAPSARPASPSPTSATSTSSQPTLFYPWQKQFFENGAAAFEPKNPTPPSDAKDRRIAALQREAPAQERGPLRTDGGTYPTKKRAWGTLNGAWVPHDTRDAIVDFVRHWSEPHRDPASGGSSAGWASPPASSTTGGTRYGMANEHNALVPRDCWLEDWEKQAILDFHAALSPGRLPAAGLHDARRRRRRRQPLQRLPRAQGAPALIEPHNGKPSLKGQGLRAAAAAPRALARRCLVHQHRRDVLLPVQPPRRLQPVHRPLGDPRDA